MRASTIDISITMKFPCGRPDRNGVCYTREAVEKALSSMERGVPIPILFNSNPIPWGTVGYTTSAPYAIAFDKEAQMVKFTIDGIIMNGGTQCFVNNRDDKGRITDFTITSIGFSE